MASSLPTSCRRCSRVWTSRRQAHCTGCCRHFSSVTSFDAHQTAGDTRAVCHDPADRGLVLREDAHGELWRTPADPRYLAYLDTLDTDGVPDEPDDVSG